MRKANKVAIAIIATSIVANVAFNAAHAADVKDGGFSVSAVAASASKGETAAGLSFGIAKIAGNGLFAATATNFDSNSKNSNAGDTRLSAYYLGTFNTLMTSDVLFGYQIGYEDRLSVTDEATVKDAKLAGLSVTYPISTNTVLQAAYSTGAGSVVNKNGAYVSVGGGSAAYTVDKTAKNQRIEVASASVLHTFDEDLSLRLGVKLVRDEVNFSNTETTLSLTKTFSF